MKFKIFTTMLNYRKEYIGDLESIGFTFKPSGRYEDLSNYNMPGEFFSIQQPVEIEISSLEELLKLSERFGQIIVNEDKKLEIYNDHHS